MTRPVHSLGVAGALVGLVAITFSPAATAQTRSPFVGTRVGANRSGEDVRVKREVGNLGGYDDRLQAIAVARMGGAEPAVVVKGRDRRWHALETTANFYGGGTSADNSYVTELFGLPSKSAIDATRKKVAALRSLGAADLGRERTFLATLVFGVEEREVLLIGSSSNRVFGKINVTANMPAEIGGQHGPEGAATETFEKGKRTAIEVNASNLDAPLDAAAVLFHETSHRLDYEQTQALAARYETETRRTFVPGRFFVEWLSKIAPVRISRADAELAADVADRANGSSEARAYVKTFLAALEAGAPDLATKQLTLYAAGLTGDATRRQRINPPTGANVTTALKAELETTYRRLPDDQKRTFDAAFATIQARFPSPWISKFDHATALPRR